MCYYLIRKVVDYMNNNEQVISSNYKPISAWGYIGYQLLFGLPLIGFIFILVFSFGGTSNENLKNYARSFLIWLLFGLIVAIFVSIIFIVLMILAGGTISIQ